MRQNGDFMGDFYHKCLEQGIVGMLGFEFGTVPFFLAMVICIVVPYLLGSINFAIIFSKVFHHDDVRTHGSGNAGSTNMLRTYGIKTAALTFLCETCQFEGVLVIKVGVDKEGLAHSPAAIYDNELCFLG